jgi:hypothetical protein
MIEDEAHGAESLLEAFTLRQAQGEAFSIPHAEPVEA